MCNAYRAAGMRANRERGVRANLLHHAFACQLLVMSLPEPYGFIARLGIGTGLRWGELTRVQSTDIQDGQLVVQHKTKSGKVRRVRLSRELLQEVRFRVGKLVPLNDPSGFARQVRRLTGIEGFHAHQMRHTFASQMLERGVSLAALQSMLGHSSVTVTERYARISDEMVRSEFSRAIGEA